MSETKPAKKTAKKRKPAARRKTASKRGRPTGSKTQTPDFADVLPSRCKRCGSTERDPYFGPVVSQRYNGTDPQGRHYNLIVRRRTRCKACRQLRIDRFFEMVSE